ncbi:MAG: PepSY domain-containing protein [Candidatus Manganitrophus sp.]|nr:PepSY domain-containing protein [Candidatus Manganitrophus sp.]MDC4227720.1 PepSY domain-containing protein [Candidatus Manganitrophus sp.]WDT70822.1 MAG: PepSY domain-containing protein [Candidatus Manganitrophus sp.]WDT81914.1 MAG: PepSY domain-containing protein [Candidatus Manganitrophus sp.]
MSTDTMKEDPRSLNAETAGEAADPSTGNPLYRAVWRWHFYAGLFSIPFIVALSITGAIYLFKPQVEAWLDRPYDSLGMTGRPAGAAAQVAAALAAVPGSTLKGYELPNTPDAAAQILVTHDGEETRVYLHPETLQILKSVKEEERPMNVIASLHGRLWIGNVGSAIVELAASWAIIMLLTGLYLWWPRQTRGLGGVFYTRWERKNRLFWRDLHAVTGVWISGLAFFLLLTGLPWAYLWGNYFKAVRSLTGMNVAKQDWATGRPAAPTPTASDHAAHTPEPDGTPGASATNYDAIDRIVATVAPLNLFPPVVIAPPQKDAAAWTAKSEAQDRPLRVSLWLDGATGAILKREEFKDRPLIDRAVGIGIAAHEGQLFGWPNQLLGLLTALGLILLSVSSVIMWRRRRPQGALGAPRAFQRPRLSVGLGLLIVLLGLYLPLFAASALVVTLTEKWVLSRIPSVRDWLGLAAATGKTPG